MDFDIERFVKYSTLIPIGQYTNQSTMLVEFLIGLSRLSVLPSEIHFDDLKVEYGILVDGKFVKELKALSTHFRISIGWSEQ